MGIQLWVNRLNFFNNLCTLVYIFTTYVLDNVSCTILVSMYVTMMVFCICVAYIACTSACGKVTFGEL